LWEVTSSPLSRYPQIITLAILIAVTHIKNRWLLHSRNRLYHSPLALSPLVIRPTIIILGTVLKSTAILIVEAGVQRNALLKLVTVVG